MGTTFNNTLTQTLDEKIKFDANYRLMCVVSITPNNKALHFNKEEEPFLSYSEENTHKINSQVIGEIINYKQRKIKNISIYFLSNLNNIFREDGEQKAMDYIYSFIDSKLRSGNFEIIKQVLKNVDCKLYTDSMTFGFLATTKDFKEELSNERENLIDEFKKHLNQKNADTKVLRYLDNLS